MSRPSPATKRAAQAAALHPEKTPWLEYRLEALEFANGGKIGFRRARMLYNETDHIIAIEHIGATPAQIDAALDAVKLPNGKMPPITEILYEINVEGYRGLFFYHPLQAGAGVYLLPREAGRSRLFFSQADGRKMFSKEWTLAEITAGKVPSEKNVWQFHGWRHEH